MILTHNNTMILIHLTMTLIHHSDTFCHFEIVLETCTGFMRGQGRLGDFWNQICISRRLKENTEKVDKKSVKFGISLEFGSVSIR